MNYLTVDVYRSAGIDCTNNGVTSDTMFGGNFVYTTDSRFKELYGSNPIHVHDRIEN
jgi:hypothetical protein